MGPSTNENGLPAVKTLFDRKRRVINRNRLDFERRFGRSSETAQRIFRSAMAAIDLAFADDPRVSRNIVIWSSDDHKPGSVRPGQVVEALLLLRHPAIGYKGLVRRTTVHGPGQPIYRIWYRHRVLGN